jgi:S1-C subfamily serine protease
MPNWKISLAVLVTVIAFAVVMGLLDGGVDTGQVSSRSAIGTIGRMGYLVEDVVPDSPAIRAGVVRGDIIVRINDASVDSAARMRDLTGNQPPRRLSVHVLRYDLDSRAWQARELVLIPVPVEELSLP